MIYPGKKIPVAKIGFNFDKLSESVKDADFGLGSSIGNAGSMFASMIKDKTIGEGVSVRTGGEAALSEGLAYAGTGFDIGNKIVPGVGGVVGGAVGLVGGAVKGILGNKKEKRDALREFSKRLKGRSNDQADESRMYYGGIDLFADGLYEEGGKAPASNVTGGAIVLGGKGHNEGGNEIVDAETGRKVAETESGELLLDIDQTNKIESVALKGDSEAMGKLMRQIIAKETTDRTGAYRLRSKKPLPSGKPKMLQREGLSTSFHLRGKERIFSREATNRIISMAKSPDTPESVRRLGEFVINELAMQDLRPPEYKFE